MKISPVKPLTLPGFERRSLAPPNPVEQAAEVVTQIALLEVATEIAKEIFGYGADGSPICPVRSSTFSEVA